MMDILIGMMTYCLYWLFKEVAKWPSPPSEEHEVYTTPRDPFYILPPLQG